MGKSRAARKVAIAEHLWEVYEQMGDEMGSDREGLINQAMFMFARLNGFLAAGGGEAAVGNNSVAKVKGRAKAAPEDVDEPGSDEDGEDGEDDAAARRREVEERVLETAAKLERDIKGRADRTPEPQVDDEFDEEEIDDDEIVDELMGEISKKNLYLMAEDGELDKVAKDRFLIGRGKHCDFVIQSGKVSREHAVIVKEGDDFYVEDLGSSNGTWFNKKRIKRRKVQDGDEFFICSEKIKMVIR